jgi:hypothetical protein
MKSLFVTVLAVVALTSSAFAQSDSTTATAPDTVRYQTHFIAVQAGLITNTRAVGSAESKNIDNTPVFHLGLSQETIGSAFFEDSRFRSSYSLGVVGGAFQGNVWTDIANNLRFQTSTGYIVWQERGLNLYPYIGIGAQRFRADSSNGLFTILIQGGIGAEYLVPQTPLLLGARLGYNYTIASLFALPKNIVPNQGGFGIQLYAGFRLW